MAGYLTACEMPIGSGKDVDDAPTTELLLKTNRKSSNVLLLMPESQDNFDTDGLLHFELARESSGSERTPARNATEGAGGGRRQPKPSARPTDFLLDQSVRRRRAAAEG
jgi:hypothetical protein